MKVVKNFNYWAERSLKHKGENKELNCSIDLEVGGKTYHAYSVSLSSRDLLFFTDQGTFNYVIDTYGEKFKAELYSVDLDEEEEEDGEIEDGDLHKNDEIKDHDFYKAAVYTEVLNTYQVGQIKDVSFEDFFAEVDVTNSYEEDWPENKDMLEPIYKEVFEDIQVFLTDIKPLELLNTLELEKDSMIAKFEELNKRNKNKKSESSIVYQAKIEMLKNVIQLLKTSNW